MTAGSALSGPSLMSVVLMVVVAVGVVVVTGRGGSGSARLIEMIGQRKRGLLMQRYGKIRVRRRMMGVWREVIHHGVRNETRSGQHAQRRRSGHFRGKKITGAKIRNQKNEWIDGWMSELFDFFFGLNQARAAG